MAYPEQALLLVATGISSAETRCSIDRLLTASINWTHLIELALTHRMTPALLAALENADPSLVPPDLLHALRLHCNQLRAQSTALTTELFELLDALASESVFAVPFKGPPLAEFLFGDAGLRYPGDLDILVHRADVSRLCELLESRGYVDAGQRRGVPPLTPTQLIMYRRVQCEHTYVRDSDSVVVEPHWGLSQYPLGIDIDYADMLARARPIQLGGRAVLALAPEDLLLALCIHGSKHRWERLAWIRDVGALATRCQDLGIEACVESARASGCLRLVLVGLALARRCAGVNLPVTVVRLIEADETAAALAQQSVAWLFDPVKESPRNDRVDWFRLVMRERWGDRIRYVMRTALWPTRIHLEILALPHQLSWLYFPVKWGHDFAALPIWQFVKRNAKPLRSK